MVATVLAGASGDVTKASLAMPTMEELRRLAGQPFNHKEEE